MSDAAGIARRGLWTIALASTVLAGCLGLAAVARAECPCVIGGARLTLDQSGFEDVTDGDFNLIPNPDQDPDDPSFLFRQDIGTEGDAGLAIYMPAFDQTFGVVGDHGYSKVFQEDPVTQQTEDGLLVTRHYWIDDPSFAGDGPAPVYLDITETVLLSYTNQTVSIKYVIENVSGAPLRFRPYLLGAPYLLNQSQAESNDNTIRSTYSTAPLPTLGMSSTKANRTLSVISTGANKADSAQVYGYDPASGELALDLLYLDVLEPPDKGDAFSGPFRTSELTDPGFGMEWSDWMSASGLANGQTAQIEATLSFAKPTPGGGGGPAAGGVPISGTVLIKQPDGTFAELQPGEEIPNRSVIDTTNGTVQLSTQDGSGTPQTAAFRGGLFRLLRTAGSPITTLKLEGQLACRGRSSSSATRSLSTRARGKGRKLWGSGKGKFRTQGKRGSGSVRGTIWEVTDRCDGSTQIRSLRGQGQGIVDAVDIKRPKKKIPLRPGRSYVAKPRR